MIKTHNCGQLRKTDVNKEVTLVGWLHSRRDHGGLIFIDLRDREGLTQVVFNPQDIGADMFKEAEKLRSSRSALMPRPSPSVTLSCQTR